MNSSKNKSLSLKNVAWVVVFILLYLLLWLIMLFLGLNFGNPWAWVLTGSLVAILSYFAIKYQKVLGVIMLSLTLIFWGYLVSNLRQAFCFNYGDNGTMIDMTNYPDEEKRKYDFGMVLDQNSPMVVSSGFKGMIDCELDFSYLQAFQEIFTKNWFPNQKDGREAFGPEQLSGRQEKIGEIIHRQFDEVWQDVVGEEVIILGHNSQDESWYFINSFSAPHDLLNDQFIEQMIRLSPATTLSPDGQLIAYRDKGGLKVRRLMDWELVAKIDDLNADLLREPNERSWSWARPELAEAMILNWVWSPDSRKLMLNEGRQPYYLWNLDKLGEDDEITTYNLGGNGEEYWYGIGWLPMGFYAAQESVSTRNQRLRIAMINPDNNEIQIVDLKELFPEELEGIYFGGVEMANLLTENKITIKGLDQDFFEDKLEEIENLNDDWTEEKDEEIKQKRAEIEQEVQGAWKEWTYDVVEERVY